MQVIFDNIAALVIGSVVMLILGAVHQRGQHAAVEANAFYALKQQQLTFVQVLQHDLNSAVSLTSASIDPASGSFTFQTRPDPAGTALRGVTYRRVAEQQPDGSTAERIVRMVDGKESGATGPFVTRWAIQVRNGEGKAVSSAVDGREIAVSIELTYPTSSKTDAVEKLTFDMTFYPPLLQQRTTI